MAWLEAGRIGASSLPSAGAPAPSPKPTPPTPSTHSNHPPALTTHPPYASRSRCGTCACCARCMPTSPPPPPSGATSASEACWPSATGAAYRCVGTRGRAGWGKGLTGGHPRSSQLPGCQLLHRSARPLLQVWKDALTSKQQSPYMAHQLAGGGLRRFAFCPYEVRRWRLYAAGLLGTADAWRRPCCAALPSARACCPAPRPQRLAPHPPSTAPSLPPAPTTTPTPPGRAGHWARGGVQHDAGTGCGRAQL